MYFSTLHPPPSDQKVSTMNSGFNDNPFYFVYLIYEISALMLQIMKSDIIYWSRNKNTKQVNEEIS